MKMKTLTIPVGTDEKISGILCTPNHISAHSKIGVIIAHGAGNDMQEPMIVRVCEGLAQEGHVTLRFNFLYREKGHMAPDTQTKLESTWKWVHLFFTESLSYEFNTVIIGGKSMGGRVASQMTASGKINAQGLILLGYPLHPPGKKNMLRDSHLYETEVPMLFFAGTRDTLCDISLLKGVLSQLKASWDLMIIEGGDHSFHLPKSSKIDQEDVYDKVVRKCNGWIESMFK